MGSSISPRWTSSASRLRPFLAEQIGAGQAAVAADHHQPVDTVLDQIAGGGQPAFPLAKRRAAGGTDDGATPVQDTADIIPGEYADAVATVHHPLIAFEDGMDRSALI